MRWVGTKDLFFSLTMMKRSRRRRGFEHFSKEWRYREALRYRICNVFCWFHVYGLVFFYEVFLLHAQRRDI